MNCRLLYFIYIPIWRDLKDMTAEASQATAAHLHSNMERFKDANNLKTDEYGIIYIPIWRDLKQWYFYRSFLSYIDIYIPIWRDLKFKFTPISDVGKSDLHSNMERFKVCTTCSGIVNL